MTLTAYARRRGVSVKAVSKAVAAGRLCESVVRDKHGAPKIADPELADREWEANTRTSIIGSSVRTPVDVPNPAGVSEPKWDAEREYKIARARREIEAARREAALADMSEIEVAEKRGELVPVAEAEAHWTDTVTVIKTKILGIPSRVAQRLPHIGGEVVPVLDEMLREALEEIATSADGSPLVE